MGCFMVLKSKKKNSDQITETPCIIGNNHVPKVLPEPQTDTRVMPPAPPSFGTGVKPVNSISPVRDNGKQVLSAPSALDATEQNALASVEHVEQEELKHHSGPKEKQRLPPPYPLPTPQPLPLPTPPRSSGALKGTNSFKSGTLSSPLYDFGSLPLPPIGPLQNFAYAEIAAACHNFTPDRCLSQCLSSTAYRASFGENASSLEKFEATVNCLHSSTHGLKEFINEVNTLASLQNPNLCKLLGFHASDGSEPRMLVYERLYHGSLDRHLFGKFDGPPLDWNSRIKIAICAAQGLAFLHEEGPFQAMYNGISTANIQIDKDYSAKLSGYGFAGNICAEDISDICSAIGILPVETLERGILTPKSNVWSFGIILLELLTGRKNLDSCYPEEERDLVKWSRPFLTDDHKLSLMITDHRLRGRFPCEAARALADITQRCLREEPSERPNMRTVVTYLRMVDDMRNSNRFPLLEPGALLSMSAKDLSKSPSTSTLTEELENRKQ
ncbi:hypothetical protein RIF29_25919 [Crotalaria pallida]|uniref:Protein kinase domain-containing protein n=1 Tax=Crotalaria pallida TaxID=3830 RepID=A0AAN9EM56_CROPI